MKKLTVGIKIDNKVVYLKTINIKDDFAAKRLIALLEIYFKHNAERK